MTQQGLLRSVPVQFVHLDATLPLDLLDELYHRHYLSQVTEIRLSTRRTNIAYTVHRLTQRNTNIVQAAAAYFQAWWVRKFPNGHGLSQAITFVRTKKDSDRLRTLLSCPSFHVDGGDAEAKVHILTQTTSARNKNGLLLGTPSLDASLDYPHVQLVVHMDEPCGLINFAQESDRTERDRVGAEYVIILRKA